MKSWTSTPSRIATLLVCALALGALAGLQSLQSTRADDDLFELRKNFEIFGALFEEIVVGYAEDVRPQPLMKAGVDAMLADLDPYTRYYDQADNMDIAQMRTGPQATVGLNIGMERGQLTVLAPESANSGYRSGVQVGDVLLSVDGVDVAELTVRDVVTLLRGEEGSSVELVFERESEVRPIAFSLQREIPARNNVTYSGYLGPDSTDLIGYVRLEGFGARAAREVRRAFREMVRGSGLNAAVLDLRDNPGGLVNEAVELVGLFVPKGTVVVSIQGRDEARSQQYVTENDPLMEDVPLVVLVNEFSASSSEIVSGALQDLDRAVIIGDRTFGKGLVQVGRALPYNSSMRMTIGHYYTPRGRDLQSRQIASRAAELARPSVETFQTVSGRPVRSGVGIEPDIPVPAPRHTEMYDALVRNGAFFRFAGYWTGRTQEAPAADAVYEEFAAWLEQQGFSYRSEAEASLEKAMDELPEAWDDDIAGAITDVQERIAAQKEGDLLRIREPVVQALTTEILARQLPAAEFIRVGLGSDAVANEALGVLLDDSRYHSILTR